jgi:HEAT repeat protein
MLAMERLKGDSNKLPHHFWSFAFQATSFSLEQPPNCTPAGSLAPAPTNPRVRLEIGRRTSPMFCRGSILPQVLAKMIVAVLLCFSFPPAFAQTAAQPATVPQTDDPSNRPVPSVDDQSHKPKPLSPWQILTAGATNHNVTRRGEAVAALGTIGPKTRVVGLLQQSLHDEDASIRQLAATTLGEMRARAAIPKLKEALQDDAPAVRFAAAKSLWLMGNRAGREIFIQILSGEKSSSNGVLKDQLQATKKKLQDPEKLALIGAKEAASSFFGPAGWGIKIMEEALQDRSASARALSAILLGPDATLDGLEQLQGALADKNWIVRAAAAQALGSSRHRDQIQYLRPLLQDDKPAVRYMSAASIVRLSDLKVVATPAAGVSARSEVRPAIDPRAPATFR